MNRKQKNIYYNTMTKKQKKMKSRVRERSDKKRIRAIRKNVTKKNVYTPLTLGNPFNTIKSFCPYSQCSHLTKPFDILPPRVDAQKDYMRSGFSLKCKRKKCDISKKGTKVTNPLDLNFGGKKTSMAS